MIRVLRYFLLVLLLCMGFSAVEARQVPAPVQTAVDLLGKLVGKPLTINDMDNWRYEQQNFPNAALGCPQAGFVYAEVISPGFQVVLMYAGIEYDYRVPLAGGTPILCKQGAAPGGQTCPPADDPGYLVPRLSMGMTARVVPGGVPNNVRAQPGTSGQLVGEIPAGAVFQVVAGPSCSTLDKLVWWQVNFNGLTGWTPEGKAPDYWVEPLDAAGNPLPSVSTVPTPAAIAPVSANLQPLFLMEGRVGHTAMPRDGQLLAVATAASLEIYELQTYTLVYGPQVLANATAPNLAFKGDGTTLAMSEDSGVITIFNLPFGNPKATAPTAQLLGHMGKALLEFSEDGRFLISAGVDGSIRVWDPYLGTQLTMLQNDTSQITSLNVSLGRIVTVNAKGQVFLSTYGG